MKDSYCRLLMGPLMLLTTSCFALSLAGCGSVDLEALVGLERCDIFNCDGLLFRDAGHADVDDDGDMDGMDQDPDDMDDDVAGDDEHDNGVDDDHNDTDGMNEGDHTE